MRCPCIDIDLSCSSVSATLRDEGGCGVQCITFGLRRDLGSSPSGTFGTLTAENHNVYEWYVSSRVTWRRVEASLAGAHQWTPLPDNMLPENLAATENFLEFGDIDSLNPDGRTALQGIQFPSDAINSGLECRIQYSPQITILVNKVLSTLEGKYKVGSARVKRKVTAGLVGFLEVIVPTAATQTITDLNAQIWSRSAFGASLDNMIYINGLKRRRTAGW
ncbi:unnamed protein product [Xylocopa violacea]|uniref:Uncharacterized protein n=1 Tax=Xylocopa violacea TaxID=135666 RepID=A0ABP1NC00_XYLVO